jgi:hypothetical protein
VASNIASARIKIHLTKLLAGRLPAEEFTGCFSVCMIP